MQPLMHYLSLLLAGIVAALAAALAWAVATLGHQLALVAGTTMGDAWISPVVAGTLVVVFVGHLLVLYRLRRRARQRIGGILAMLTSGLILKRPVVAMLAALLGFLALKRR